VYCSSVVINRYFFYNAFKTMDLRHELNGLWATEKILMCRVRREGSGYSGVKKKKILLWRRLAYSCRNIKRELKKKDLFNSL